MKNRLPDLPLTAESHLQTNPSSDERFTIAFWMMKYETFLFRTRPYTTYERYTRALDKLFAAFPEKRFLHEFRRADLEDYKNQRLERGSSPKTVNIELSILRSFWNFLLSAEADGVMFNPVQGVRVRMPSMRNKPAAITSAREQGDALSGTPRG
jgi:site-specific recombinase XerC